MRFNQLCLGVFLALSCCPMVGSAVTYNLASDFSDVSNPNGVWSFSENDSILSHFPQPGGPITLRLATVNGFWGVGATYESAPFIFKATGNGSVTGEWNDADFLAGDVVSHAPNTNTLLRIRWTAPEAGTITYAGSIWYAHSPVTREVDFGISLVGAGLESGSVAPGQDRSNAVGFNNGATPRAVNAGDRLELALARDAGVSSFGAMAGTEWVVEFTPVPEPAASAFLTGVLMVLAAHRRR